MAFVVDVAKREVRCDSADELRSVLGELNGVFHDAPEPGPVLEPGIHEPPSTNGSAGKKNRRGMSRATRQAMSEARQRALALADQKGITLNEAWQILREIKDGTRTPTGRLRRAK